MARKNLGPKVKTGTLTVALKDDDFTIPEKAKPAVAGFRDLLKRATKEELRELETDDRIETIRKLLPDVIAKKIDARIPDGFELTQLTFTGEISGQPFGIGVSGQVSAVFEKKKT